MPVIHLDHLLNINSTHALVSKWSYSSCSIQQVAPQAAKTMSPPFARMGGFGGGSSNSFEQMPTGASPTTTSGANYPPINVRASLNTNGYGRLCVYIFKLVSLRCTTASSHYFVLNPRWRSIWGTVPFSSSRGSVAPVARPAAVTG